MSIYERLYELDSPRTTRPKLDHFDLRTPVSHTRTIFDPEDQEAWIKADLMETVEGKPRVRGWGGIRRYQ